jgi:hypothetical protein
VEAGFDLMLLGYARDKLTITDVSLKEWNLRPYRFAVAARQTIKHHHLLAARMKHFGNYASDVPGAAGYQYRHKSLPTKR